MQKTTHKFHDEILVPSDFTELMADICKPSGAYDHRVWMWRGQSDIDWRIDSSAYRRIENALDNIHKDINDDLVSYEKMLLSQATHRGYRLENGRELSDFELLAKLQHHGAATRLVDFTRNALIGIWFACNENADKSGLLVGYDSWYLSGGERKLELRSYDEIVSCLGGSLPVTWEPPLVSPRIAVQHSQFVYSEVIDHPSGSLAFPHEENAFRKYKISKKVKQEALDILFEVFDISKLNSFPDIDGFAQANSVFEDTRKMHRW